MAKRKPPRGQAGLSPDPNRVDSSERIATLRRYYELGRRAADVAPDGTENQAVPLVDLAAESGVGADTIRKARRFATAYNAEEFDELLALRDPDGQPLRWYLVRALLPVEDKAQRSDLQRRAAEQGWSRRHLWAAVQARQGGKRSSGGRRYAVPTSTRQVLGRLTELSESWLRFYADIGEEGGLAEKLRSAKRQGERSPSLKRSTREVIDRLRALQKAAKRLADRLEAVEPSREGRKSSPGVKTRTNET